LVSLLAGLHKILHQVWLKFSGTVRLTQLRGDYILVVIQKRIELQNSLLHCHIEQMDASALANTKVIVRSFSLYSPVGNTVRGVVLNSASTV